MIRTEIEGNHPLRVLLEGTTALRLELTAAQQDQFLRYQQELAAWSQRMNLTSITTDEEIQRRHFVDSLSCLLGWPPELLEPGRQIIDIGAGAGFPGVPIKIFRPELELTLVESRGKRIQFLVHLIETLGLNGVAVLNERAEVIGQMSEHRERYDVALARALATLPVLVELCLPLVRIGGMLIAPRRNDPDDLAPSVTNAVKQLGGELLEPLTVDVPGLNDGRVLVRIRKVEATPPRYPRRPGIPSKRPLSSPEPTLRSARAPRTSHPE